MAFDSSPPGFPAKFRGFNQVNESSGGDPSLEVRLEPLWRRSTLVDLAKVARMGHLLIYPLVNVYITMEKLHF